MTYTLTVHFWNDDNDELGYNEEVEANSVNEVISYLWSKESKVDVEYFIIYEGDPCDGEEVYNSQNVV
mgnify:CR=1 FL=1